MYTMFLRSLVCLLFFSSIFPQATFGGFLDSALDTAKTIGAQSLETPKAAPTNLSQDEMINGFKEALALGVKRAVEKASKDGGFLNNPEIRIPLPSRLEQVATLLKGVGLENQVSAFENTMNKAAEKAAAQALPIFGQAVKDITFEDAKRLLTGGDTAITEYFKSKTWDELYNKFLPVIHETAQQVGVTQSYEALVSQPTVNQLIKKTDFDLDHYVSQRTLEGLFTLLGEEERRIRENPTARTTDILKKVFGN